MKFSLYLVSFVLTYLVVATIFNFLLSFVVPESWKNHLTVILAGVVTSLLMDYCRKKRG